jgi:hypothetical protein
MLNKAKTLKNYKLSCIDGEIGKVKGLYFDDHFWAIRYLIVNTSNWWLGHQVLIAPQWIRDVNWSETTISVNLTRQAVKDAPPYNSAALLNREQELAIFKHYGLTGYWADQLSGGRSVT